MLDILKLPFAWLGALINNTPLRHPYHAIFEYLPGQALGFLEHLGKLFALVRHSFSYLPTLARNPRYTLDQMWAVGITSLPLITVTSVFTGAIATAQCVYTFANLVPLTYVGTAICKVTLLELGPVLTALVLASRVGAGIAAEIGTMVTNEQVDAMESLALDPFKYLIMPRIVAGLIMQVVLTIWADFIAILGAWVVAVVSYRMSTPLYLAGIKMFFSYMDIGSSLIKAMIFGFIICTMGCYAGLRAKGGAKGVGDATMQAVVSSAVLVLIFDFFVAYLIF
jgi:phospholipid/cholesterol/gamma-HCH transport system permease protein